MVTIGNLLAGHCRADSRCLVNAVVASLLSLFKERTDVNVEELGDSIGDSYVQVGRDHVLPFACVYV